MVDVAAQGEVGRQAGEAQLKIVGAQVRIGEIDGSGEAAVHQLGIDDRVAADDALDRGVERQRPALAVVSQSPALADAGEDCAAEVRLSDLQLERRVEAAPWPVECRADHRVAHRQAGAEELLVHEIDLKPSGVESVVAQIDAAVAVDADPAAPQGGGPFENAVLQSADERNSRGIAQRPRRQTTQVIAMPDEARDAVKPRAVVKFERREAVAVLIGDEGAVPFGPGPVAEQTHAKCLLRSGQSRQQPAFRRAIIEIEIEHVAVGLGVDVSGEAVSSAELPVGVHLHQPAMDVCVGLEIDVPLLAQKPLGDSHVVDHETVDADIEIRQRRRVGVAGIELGFGIECAVVQHERAHIEAGERELVRPPVEFDRRHREEQLAARVAELHVVERRVPQHRALDAPDRNLESRSGRHLGDLVDDELPPRAGVEVEDRSRNQREQHDDETPCPKRDRSQRMASPLDGDRLLASLHDLFFGHQKACPKAT